LVVYGLVFGDTALRNGEKVVIDFLVNVATLGLAIFVGSVAYDWWRKNKS